MSHDREDRALELILESIDHIQRTKNNDPSCLYSASVRDLDNNGRAILWGLMIVADAAAHRLSDELKQRHPDLPWHDVRGFRNWAVHAYDKLDMEVIRTIVDDDLPAIQTALRQELLRRKPP